MATGVLGIDLGGTRIHAPAVAADGSVLGKPRRGTEAVGVDAALPAGAEA